jgi:hypothetical protein
LYYDPCALAILIREYVPFENCQAETNIRNRRAYEREGRGKSDRHFVLFGGGGGERKFHGFDRSSFW